MTLPRHTFPAAIAALLAGIWLGFAVLVAAIAFPTQPAHALSEIQREELPAPSKPSAPSTDAPEKAVPMPDPVAPPGVADPDATGPMGPQDTTDPQTPDEPDAQTPDADEPIPTVQYDVAALPAEVRRLRDLILAACKSGDLEKLRPLIGLGDSMTQLSLAGIDGDPIQYLKSLAGDEDGQEILAILEEVLSAGYVHLDVGTPEELYVWPYFFAVPTESLTAPQRVELFKIVTAGEYEEMKNYGSYIFYRVGITPDGRWAFFVAGE